MCDLKQFQNMVYMYQDERRVWACSVVSNLQNDVILKKTHGTKVDYRTHMTIGNT